MGQIRWSLAEPIGDDALSLDGWSTPMRQLLHNRGLQTREAVEAFLYPEMGGLHDPFLMKGMEIAVDRVFKALRGEELIALYGDFDADGLTAVALLKEVLESPNLQGRVVSYLPHRTREGYGLNGGAVQSLAAQGVRLIITADCGVGADREIELASRLGVDVIVTDHHQVTSGPPPALAVLNPRQEGCSYPFKGLAGVGVAYKLAEGLLATVWGLEEARQRLEAQLDLVALGSVADLAPLIGENRLMVRAGLLQMKRGKRVGLQALASVGGFSGRPIDADAIGYLFAPRLNAAGRMGDARLSLELLTCSSEEEGARLATDLESANRDRQAATLSALTRAREEISLFARLPAAIVLTGEYPAGIMGLVASKLAEEYQRPTFIVEMGDGECRGSGRGVPGFDVVGTLSGMSGFLSRFGGHAQAGGFAFESCHLARFREQVEAAAVDQLRPDEMVPELALDAALTVSQVNGALYNELSLLEPFGVGNRRPLFLSSRVQVRDVRIVGVNHLRLWVCDSTAACSAIGFGMGTPEHDFVRPGALLDCAFVLSRNDRGGTVGYEMGLKKIRPAAEG